MWEQAGRAQDRPYGCTTNKHSESASGQPLEFHTSWAHETDRQERAEAELPGGRAGPAGQGAARPGTQEPAWHTPPGNRRLTLRRSQRSSKQSAEASDTANTRPGPGLHMTNSPPTQGPAKPACSPPPLAGCYHGAGTRQGWGASPREPAAEQNSLGLLTRGSHLSRGLGGYSVFICRSITERPARVPNQGQR